jgi:hypothetical protein
MMSTSSTMLQLATHVCLLLLERAALQSSTAAAPAKIAAAAAAVAAGSDPPGELILAQLSLICVKVLKIVFRCGLER